MTRKKVKKILIILALIPLALYLVICATLYIKQSSLIFHSSPLKSLSPEGIEVENVYFETADGLVLHGWFYDAKIEDAPTVVFSHGNAGNVSLYRDQLEVFRELGMSGLVYDYRGFGRSEGELPKNETEFFQDAEAALQFLQNEKGIDKSNIIAWGESIGCSAAVYLAEKNDLHAIVLESPFYSLEKLIAEIYPMIPIRLLLKFPLNSAERIVGVKTPLIIIHSTEDEAIPYQHGSDLFQKATMVEKEFVTITGSHNRGIAENIEQYISKLKAFFGRINNKEET
jgi:fermentation-respiration switch protein FrsA (DUF1100 family)